MLVTPACLVTVISAVCVQDKAFVSVFGGWESVVWMGHDLVLGKLSVSRKPCLVFFYDRMFFPYFYRQLPWAILINMVVKSPKVTMTTQFTAFTQSYTHLLTSASD